MHEWWKWTLHCTAAGNSASGKAGKSIWEGEPAMEMENQKMTGRRKYVRKSKGTEPVWWGERECWKRLEGFRVLEDLWRTNKDIQRRGKKNEETKIKWERGEKLYGEVGKKMR